MKTLKVNRLFLLVLLVSGWMGANGQTTLESEVPGDNFSLEGALELFKKSASPEEFEKQLNSANSKVNNLDLNNDGNIDYVRVIDRNEGNVHAFIIQAVLSETESQDVAVIELEKLQDGKAVLQITGDADVYGVETIIEPTEEVRVNAGTTTTRAVVNVWTWPSVQYVYSPYYSAWDSPWGWAYHPFWWHPWRPVAYYVYSPWWRPYRPYYSLCYSHRIGYLPRLYRPYRTTSVIVYNNHHHQIDRYRSRNDGRDRYDGRSRDGRDRYEGYGRSRADYSNRDNHDSGRRYDANVNTSRDRSRSDGTSNRYSQQNEINTDRSRNTDGSRYQRNELNTDRSRNTDRSKYQRNELNTDRSTSTPGRSYERSSSDFRSSPDRTPRSSGMTQRTPERRSSMNQVPQKRQPGTTFDPGSRQQRSSGSHSLQKSSGRSSTPASGGRGQRNSNGNSRSNQRGRD